MYENIYAYTHVSIYTCVCVCVYVCVCVCVFVQEKFTHVKTKDATFNNEWGRTLHTCLHEYHSHIFVIMSHGGPIRSYDAYESVFHSYV